MTGLEMSAHQSYLSPETRVEGDPFGDIRLAEISESERLHLGVDIPKTCVAILLAGEVQPMVGNRNLTSWAIAADLRRAGATKEQVLRRMNLWYETALDPEVRDALGKDGEPFRLPEIEATVESAFRPLEPHSPGCNHHVWNGVCVGKDKCPFYKHLRRGQDSETWTAGVRLFWSLWPQARGRNGRRLVSNADKLVYMAIANMEQKRDYDPGTLIIAKLDTIAEEAGVSRKSVGRAIGNLVVDGLITDHVPGRKRTRGNKAKSTQLRRVIPVPRPTSPPIPSLHG